MGLQARLFLTIGSLILLISVLTYVLPNYLVKLEIDSVGQTIVENVQSQEERLFAFVELAIKDHINQQQDNLTRLQNVFLGTAFIREILTQGSQEQFEMFAKQIMTLENQLVFIQLTDTSKNQVFIFPKELKPLTLNDLKKNMIYVDKQQPLKSYFVNSQKIDEDRTLTLGMSFSQFIGETAKTLHRKVVAYFEGVSLGFSENGQEDKSISSIPISDFNSPERTLIWDHVTYNYSSLAIDLETPIHLYFLIPVSESISILPIMNQARTQLVHAISLDLSSVVLLCFLAALFLLARISKKIVKPISILAQATEKVSQGKYEAAKLPKYVNHDDEISVLYHSFDRMVKSLKDREKIRGMLNKVVSKEIADEILKGDIPLHGERRMISLLFSDIRGFTPFSESIEPEMLFQTMNDYLNMMCHIIDEKKGVVDKFVGDEIMALYGAPINLKDHAFEAVSTAVEMMKRLHVWNQERAQKGLTLIEIGIGVHTGEVLAGNVGADDRLNYTVLGANVNLAARLCSIAKPMQILISENTFNEPFMKEHFSAHLIPQVSLKGIDHPVDCYDLKWDNNLDHFSA